MSDSPADAILRLSSKIVAGEVVFFIGAGFSLDSEGNSAWKLAARLLARFESICRFLTTPDLITFREPVTAAQTTARLERMQQRVDDLRDTLVSTFALPKQESVFRFTTSANAAQLAKRYYEFNDWICNAFSILLVMIEELSEFERLAESIADWENEYLRGDLGQVGRVPIRATEFRHILNLPDLDKRGKALFLDTMGFDDKATMRGEPRLRIDRVIASYQDDHGNNVLRPRHHVLAWMAREGFCPVVLTTNYDLLLEGAYRLAGFDFLVPSEVEAMQARQTGVRDPQLEAIPKSAQPQFARVARDVHYFNAAGVQQTALLYKIHGCVETYRQNKNSVADWNRYLESMVFTFREIQNWRNDSWSRDLLNTLLRTQTVAFSGYSTEDPVIHDTFRKIYEEMAQRRFEASSERKPGVTWRSSSEMLGDDAEEEDDSDPYDAENAQGDGRFLSTARRAPAYFMDLADKKSFHGLEVLRAASRAVGDTLPVLGSHPNHLAFEIGRGGEPAQFPTLDELLQWIFHCSLRRFQYQLVDRHLWSTSHQTWGRGSAAADNENILKHFREILKFESRAFRSWKNRSDEEVRRQFEQIVGWTTSFHRLFMREYAIAEAAARLSTADEQFPAELRQWPWYFPCSDRPQAAVWSVVLEISIRRMAAVAARRPDDGLREANRWCDAIQGARPLAEHPDFGQPTGSVPCIELRPGPDLHTPHYVLIRAEVGANAPRVVADRTLVWSLRPSALPWRSMGTLGREAGQPQPDDKTPEAAYLWQWAALSEEPFAARAADDTLRQFLGIRNRLRRKK